MDQQYEVMLLNPIKDKIRSNSNGEIKSGKPERIKILLKLKEVSVQK